MDVKTSRNLGEFSVSPPHPEMQQQQPQQQQVLLQQVQQQLQQQPQIVYPTQNQHPGYNKKIVNILGILQIVFGCVCIVLQAVSIGTQSGLFFVGHGVWCSILYIVAGSLSVGASKTLSSCMGPAVFLQVLALLVSLAEIIAAIMTAVYGCNFKAQRAQTNHIVQYINMPDGQTVPMVILGPNTTPGQPIMINPGMVMPQQQAGPSTTIQAEAPPAYQAMANSAPQEIKEKL
ncbi:hypothetical protein CAPTEDRAFT_188949 [Capitella teleta]|uniref:Uncharacterized protein n=1 Tax=Capitella teleta TaxID=283909 RepID=R7UBP2_CAPTE|nr:hypothetical protein CAPTEDRAFT_188949 [Capitella teleta]|eukprot:ELU03399.1 hypothetical protein CAPTEDRAFT_188949 [Capitella teleta]